MFIAARNFFNDLDVESIPLSRKRDLDNLTDYINSSLKNYKKAQLTFICTHNSRRSHLCQIWAQAASRYYEIGDVFCYSGGTEVTALFPKVVDTLKGQGLEITFKKKKKNPNYFIEYSEIMPPIKAFSKKYDHKSNPKSEFAAIMTCDHASENCPVVLGADQRIALTYEDPKASDGTDQQDEVYASRSIQIATEMKYVFSKVTI